MIDKLCYSSKLRYINSYLKCSFTCSSLFFCVLSRSIVIGLIVLITMSILTVCFGKIRLKLYIKLLGEVLAFLFLSTIAILFSFSKHAAGYIAIPIFRGYLTIYPESAALALQLIMTAFSSVSCLYFLSLSTPMTDILMVLRKLHCPDLILELMLLIYRFIFLLLDVVNAIGNSQKSRLGNKNYKTSIQSFGKLLSVLLARAFKRSSNLYDAMESRCYDGRILVLEEHKSIEKKQLLFVLLFELVLILCYIFERSF